jgi:hypothetical protein
MTEFSVTQPWSLSTEHCDEQFKLATISWRQQTLTTCNDCTLVIVLYVVTTLYIGTLAVHLRNDINDLAFTCNERWQPRITSCHSTEQRSNVTGSRHLASCYSSDNNIGSTGLSTRHCVYIIATTPPNLNSMLSRACTIHLHSATTLPRN